MDNDISIYSKLKAFITFSFSFKVNSFFFNKASLYLSGRLLILYSTGESLTISVILYNLKDELVVSLFENVLFKSVVLTKSPISYFGFTFFLLSNKLL